MMQQQEQQISAPKAQQKTNSKKRKLPQEDSRNGGIAAKRQKVQKDKKSQKKTNSASVQKKSNKFASLDSDIMSAQQFMHEEIDEDEEMLQNDNFQNEQLVDVDAEMRKLGVEERRGDFEDDNDEEEQEAMAQLRNKVFSKKVVVNGRGKKELVENSASSSDSNDDTSSSDDEQQAVRSKSITSTEKPDKKKREFGVDIDRDEYRMLISGRTHMRDEGELSSDEEDDEFNVDGQGGILLGSESDEESDDPLKEMIAASRQIDEERALVEEEADDELKAMALHQPDSTLMQDMDEYRRIKEEQGDENELGAPPPGSETAGLFQAEDITQIYARIAENLRVLTNFKKFKEEGYTRQDYLELLKEDLCKYYGYLPDLIDKFASMFSAAELVELLEANEAPRPVVLRTNPLKSRRREVAEALIRRGVNLDPLDRWSNVGLKVYDTEVPVGATPEYLAGWYMIQGASSFLPVIALNPEPNEVVVDMASAPGGKTTYMSALMKNTGVIYANDPEKKRTKGLTANIYRLGVRNAIVCNYDGRELPAVVHPKADKVLLDAPCTGTGIIARDPSVKTTRDNVDITNMSKLQKELLLAAIDTCKDPQKSDKPVYIVYSTCSICPEENEEVISYAMKKRFVRVVDTGLPKKLGKPGFKKVFNKRFDPSVELSRRIYPHAHNMDGFYVCKLQKYADGPRDEQEKHYKKVKHEQSIKERQLQKKENIKLQKEREIHNKKLLQTAEQHHGGNTEAARQWMKERKSRMLSDPEYKNIKPSKGGKRR